MVVTCNLFGLTSAAGIYGRIADGGVEIICGCGIGPISKWVNDHIFMCIKHALITDYNARRVQVADHITQNEGWCQSCSQFWYSASLLQSGRQEEYNDDMQFPSQDLSAQSPRSAEDMKFAYCMANIDLITSSLGIPWEKSKDLQFCNEAPFTGLSLLQSLRCATFSCTNIMIIAHQLPKYNMPGLTRTRFGAALVPPNRQVRPHPHQSGLQPPASVLHPHALAKSWLQMWLPTSPRSAGRLLLSPADIQ